MTETTEHIKPLEKPKILLPAESSLSSRSSTTTTSGALYEGENPFRYPATW